MADEDKDNFFNPSAVQTFDPQSTQSDFITTSTPNPGSARRKRRSWFEKDRGAKFEIAVENKTKRRSIGKHRKSEEEIEVLLLTHFINPPRIGFGKLKPGDLKRRHLLLKNPHEYPQEVKVEKFPYKKNFDTEETNFTVEAEGTHLMTITWMPENEGPFREMILFQVDSSYRLQAFVFGSVEKPPAKKKLRKGLLSKNVSKPFSVIQTGALSNIAKSYSPTKEDKRRRGERILEESAKSSKDMAKGRENRAPVNTQQKTSLNAKKKCLTSDNKTQKPLQNTEVSNNLMPMVVSPIKPLIDIERTEKLGTWEKKASTLCNKNSGSGAKLFEIENSPVLRTSVTEDSLKSQVKCNDGDRPTFLSPNSFLQDSLCMAKGDDDSFAEINRQPVHSTVLPTPERVMGNPISQKLFLSPDTFLKELNNTQEKLDNKILDLHIACTIPSPEAVLDKSIPHDIMLKQLESVKASLEQKRKSLSILPSQGDHPSEAGTSCLSQSKSDSYIADNNNIRRETFVKGNAKNPFQATAECPSPRRTTFVLKGKTSTTCTVGRSRVNNNGKKMKPTSAQSDSLTKKKGAAKPKSVAKETMFTKLKNKLNSSKGKIEQDSIEMSPICKVKNNTVNSSLSVPTEANQSLNRINSATITKTTPDSLNKNRKDSAGRCLFSPEVCQSVGLEFPHISFGSPHQIPDTPTREALDKRATLTVTKERPSDALMKATQKNIATSLFGAESNTGKLQEIDELATSVVESYEVASPKPVQSEDGTTLEVSSNNDNRCSLTPHQLPTSPNPDNSRRSTHVVHKPKVLDLHSVDRKCLFPSLEQCAAVDDLPATKDVASFIDDPPVCVETSIVKGTVEVEHCILLRDQPTGKNVLTTCMEDIPTPERMIINQVNNPCIMFKDQPKGRHLNIPDDIPTPERLTRQDVSHVDNQCNFTELPIGRNLTLSDDIPTPERLVTKQGDTSREHHLNILMKKEQLRGRNLIVSNEIPTPERLITRQKDVNQVDDLGVEKESLDGSCIFEDSLMVDDSKTCSSVPLETESSHLLKSNVMGHRIDSDHKEHRIEVTRPQLTMKSQQMQSKKESVSTQVAVTSHERSKENKEDNNKLVTNDKDLEAAPTQLELSCQKESSQEVETTENVGYVGFVSISPVTKQEHGSGVKKPFVTATMKRSHSSDGRGKKESNLVNKRMKVTTSSENLMNRKTKAGSGSENLSQKPTARQTRSQPVVNNVRKVAGPTKKAVGGVSKDSKPASKPKSVAGVAQSRLLLVKKSKPALPKHPMPFASKNMYYDERWMEKQERGFIHWLNFVLTPADEYQNSNQKVKVDAGALCVDTKQSVKLAPTKEVLSIRAYTARRRLNQLRRSSCKLFQSREIVHVIQKIEAEIESLRLVVRKDRMVHADLGMKQNILDMILSFNPLWLRIGIETIYGEMIPMQNNNDVIGLSRFIVTRLLGNPDISAEYSHPTVPHLYRDGYPEAIAQHLLKKLFILIFFLDRAKSHRLIAHDPCLFCKDSEFKTTKAMLIQFSRDYLSGEGDVTRHLGYLGYTVGQKQTAMDEFDYAVTKLAIDLRDGVRLARVIELLTNNWQLSKSLRAPAISRLQKIHNMEVVFKSLQEQGVKLDGEKKVTTRDVVDGHREKTLELLWALILQYQVNVLLNADQIKEEIEILEKSLKVRNQLEALQRFEQGLKQKRRESAEPDLHTHNEKLTLLLKWTRVVCAFYGVKIENFTVSFGDGRALCALIHHYHPALLPREAIRMHTTMTYYDDLEQNHTGDLDSSDLFSPAPFAVQEDPVMYEKLLSNERSNFKLLYERASELGNIPLMLRSVDMSNTIPDEKVVVTYVCYLCARLLDIRHESRAARVIQLAWRQYFLKRSKKDLEVKQKAAVVIQRAFRKYLGNKLIERKTQAAVKIQSWARRMLACKIVNKMREDLVNKQQNQAATTIQKHVRGYLVKQTYHKKLSSAVIIQKWTRGYLQRLALQKQQSAASCIQKYYRGYRQTTQAVCEYKKLRSAALTLQTVVRRWLRNKHAAEHRAALTIQTAWRRYNARTKYLRIRSSCVVIQKTVRRFLAVKSYKQVKNAVLVIQTRFRGQSAMKHQRSDFLSQRSAAVTVQKYYRGVQARKRYRATLQSVVKLQALVRSVQQRNRYRSIVSAATVLQKHYRAHLARKIAQTEFIKTCKAVVKVQSWWRMIVTCKEFTAKKSAATTIQSLYRMHVLKLKYQKLNQACRVIQNRYRAIVVGREARNSYLAKRSAAVKIQSAYKGFVQRQKYLASKQAAVVLQSQIRSFVARKSFQKQRQAAIRIQKRWRETLTARSDRKNFVDLCQACIILQSGVRGMLARGLVKRERAARKIQTAYRRFIVRRVYHHMKNSAIKLQAAVRRFLAMKLFNKKKHSAVVLQQHYRALIVARTAKRNFLIQKGAAITIQAFYKGYLARKTYENNRHSIIKMQALVRGKLQRLSYIRWKQAAVKIQGWYRTKKQGIMVRNDYLHHKQAVIKIQACYRCWKAQREYNLKRSQITKVQAMVRGTLQRKSYRQLRRVVTTVQQRYVAKLQGRQTRREYLVMKGAAITIQAAFRGHCCEKQYTKDRHAIVKLQALVRGTLQRKSYRQLRQAVTTVQQRYVAKLQGRKMRREFLVMKGAAITIQAAFRGHCCQKQYTKDRAAIVKLQALVRGWLQRKSYTQLRQAVTTVQQRYVAKLQGRKMRREYLVMKGAAITIQAAFRGHCYQRQYTKDKAAILKLQALVRGRLQRKSYIQLRQAVTSIQQRYVAKLQGREARRTFLVQKGAAITIQAFYKGSLARKTYENKRRSIIKMQALVRGKLQRLSNIRWKQAAVKIQGWYRTKKQGIMVRNDYLHHKQAVIKIQACYRCWKARREYKLKRAQITRIQALVRGKLQRNSYTKLRQAVTTVQQRYVAKLQGRKTRREYLVMKGAAITIQAAFRGHCCQRQYTKDRHAIVKLQALVRGTLQRKSYTQLRQAVTTVQKRYVAKLQGRKTRREFLVMKGAAITIQAAFRGHCCQKQYTKDRAAIVKLQAIVKGKQQRESFSKLKKSAIIIQNHYVARKIGQAVHKEFLIKKGAAITLQAAYKGYKVRQLIQTLHRAATVIQSAYKCHRAKSQFRQVKLSAICIQRCYRNILLTRKIRRNFKQAQVAATVIQKYYRGFHARKNYRKDVELVTKTQAHVRGFLQRISYQRLQLAVRICQDRYRAKLKGRELLCKYLNIRKAAITLQAAFRGKCERNAYRQFRKTTIVVQSRVRMVHCRQEFLRLRSAVIDVQRRWRATKLMRQCVWDFLVQVGAAITIQSNFRAYKDREWYKNQYKSVIFMQACVRRNLVRRQYQHTRKAALVIQRHYRGYCAGKIQQEVYQNMRKSAIVLQAAYRGHLARRLAHSVRTERKAAMKIQAIWRMYKQQKTYKQTHSHIVRLQSHIRGMLARRYVHQLEQQHRAATCIQRMFRRFKQRQYEEECRQKRQLYLEQFARNVRVHMSAVKIQKCYRSYKVLKAAKARLQSILVIQRWMRQKLCMIRRRKFMKALVFVQAASRKLLQKRVAAATKIQAAVREWLSWKHKAKRTSAAITFQRFWRGRKVRKECRSKKIEKVRKNLQEASKNATDDQRLGNRTTSALDYLLKCRQLSQILQALIHLDSSTRLSPGCCVRLVEVNAVQVIYQLISSCNRSQPHMELIKYSVNILLNLAKYHKTVSYVYSVEGCIDVLLELMQIYREKGTIFTRTCMLLALLSMEEPCRENILTNKKMVEKIKSIHLLTAKKHKVTETRLLRQAKLNATKSFNCTLPISMTSRQHSKIQPAWVLKRNSMKEIEDPLLAINFVMNSLSIKPK